MYLGVLFLCLRVFVKIKLKIRPHWSNSLKKGTQSSLIHYVKKKKSSLIHIHICRSNNYCPIPYHVMPVVTCHAVFVHSIAINFFLVIKFN